MTLLLGKDRTHLIDDLSVNLANHLIADQHFRSESLSAEESEVFHMLLNLAIVAKQELESWKHKQLTTLEERLHELESYGYSGEGAEDMLALTAEKIAFKAELITGRVVFESLQRVKNKDLELLYKYNLLDRERWAGLNGAPTIVDIIKRYIV